MCREEEALFRRADHVRAAAGRRRDAGRGLSEQTFYRWKKEYGGMLPSEARELK
jgi:hypothetical protein